MRLLLSLALAVALSTFGCRGEGVDPQKPVPTSSAQIEELTKQGVVWNDAEVRAYYLKQVAAIGPANDKWKAEKVPAEERARRAFNLRHEARENARAMMHDKLEVDALRARDLQKYGHAEGPAFYELVTKNQERGLTGDAVYEAIVESAQNTNTLVNEFTR